MTRKPTAPTDSNEEKSKGRIAVWLDSVDVEWLAGHCCCPEDASQEQSERCARIRFRANAALHKAGLKDDKEN